MAVHKINKLNSIQCASGVSQQQGLLHLQALFHLVPSLLQPSSHLVPLLLKASSHLHFCRRHPYLLVFFIKAFLLYLCIAEQLWTCHCQHCVKAYNMQKCLTTNVFMVGYAT